MFLGSCQQKYVLFRMGAHSIRTSRLYATIFSYKCTFREQQKNDQVIHLITSLYSYTYRLLLCGGNSTNGLQAQVFLFVFCLKVEEGG